MQVHAEHWAVPVLVYRSPQKPDVARKYIETKRGDSMKKVRLGIIGLGGMGVYHAQYLLGGSVNRCEVTAVCDHDPEKLVSFDEHDNIKKFDDSRKIIRSGEVDAVLIVTPHYSHTTIGIDALGQGLHVLVEKPISVHKADCERLIAAHKNKRQVFSAMFQMRTDPHYQKIKQMIDDGELGTLTRINWIVTAWFRSEAYYASGGWRATWKGEGGGVLLNQCPHNLDLMQWFFGMPSTVRGFCSLGKYHNIEVEDEVTGYLEYPNGATGVFITTTGEAPGTNRLEICGEKGRLVFENDIIKFTRNEVPMSQFSRTTDRIFATPDVWNVEIPVDGHGGQHVEITQNFVDAILDRKPLIAPAKEGIHSVELANAMLYSSLIGRPVEMPLDGGKFRRALNKLVRESKFEKKVRKKRGKEDMGSSFK